MKTSRHRKNSRLMAAGLPLPPRATPAAKLHKMDSEQFVLETMVALKKLPPEELDPRLRDQVARWTEPYACCPRCPWQGPLTTATRHSQSRWLCPNGHLLQSGLDFRDPATNPEPVTP